MHDRFQLQRFVDAQEPVYDIVCDELRNGRKRSHWMWFIFPQIVGLGHSAMATHYAISSVDEACAYLDHPLLGARLRECAALAAAVRDRSAHDIFGYPDELKFHSSMSLFAQADDPESIFHICLRKFFDDKPDPATLARL